MAVVLARVDDRLLHGQVVEGWAPFVRADTIIVASDSVCQEKDRCRLMQLIVPKHIDLKVVPLSELEVELRELGESKVILLFAGLEDVLAVLESGVDLNSINVGNLHNIKGGKEVTPSVFLNGRDLDTIRRLVYRGVDVEAREVPGSDSLNLASYLEKEIGSQ